MTFRASIAFSAALAACSAPAGPVAVFAPLASGAADLTMVPWPNDLYLQNGRVALGSLAPLDSGSALEKPILDDVARQDGFAVTTGAFFRVSADVDPATLDGNVRLVDLESPGEIPVATWYRQNAKLIHARPKNGHVLLQRHKYAYVVLPGVKGADGNPLRASPDWIAVRDATARPADDRLGRAFDAAKPLDAFADRKSTVAAAVFTTHSVTRDLESLRAQLQAGPAPTPKLSYLFAASKQPGDDGTLDDLCGTPASNRPGEDNPGGIAHDQIGFVVQGAFDSPDWLAATVPTGDPRSPTVSLAGALGGGDSGPMPKGMATVPFTLVLPKAPAGGDYTKVQTVIFTHGLGGDRRGVVVVANQLAAKGLAVLGIDLPFHGLRAANAVDAKHDFSGAPGPDGFAESGAESVTAFFDVAGDKARGVVALDPQVIRGAFQQSVADIAAAIRLATDGKWDAAGARDARLAGLALRSDSVVYSGESFGSIIGGMVIAIEPKVGAAVLSVGGGGIIMPLLSWSPVYGPLFGTLLDASLGTYSPDGPPESDYGYNLVEYLLEPGDPLAMSPYVIQRPLGGAAPRHVCLLQAYLDESVPNVANEALAGGMGLLPVSVTAGGAPKFAWSELGAPAAAPQSGNVMAGGKPVTAAIVQFQTATHGMLTSQKGQRTFDTTTRPFRKLPSPVEVANPIDQLHAIYARFASDWFAGQAPTVPDVP